MFVGVLAPTRELIVAYNLKLLNMSNHRRRPMILMGTCLSTRRGRTKSGRCMKLVQAYLHVEKLLCNRFNHRGDPVKAVQGVSILEKMVKAVVTTV